MKNIQFVLSLNAALFVAVNVVSAAPDAPAKPPAAAEGKTQLKFQAYNVDKVNGTDFQINTPGKKYPSEFLKLGDVVAGTNWKLSSFEIKKQGEEDASELTLVDTVTKETLVLKIGKVINSPAR